MYVVLFTFYFRANLSKALAMTILCIYDFRRQDAANESFFLLEIGLLFLIVLGSMKNDFVNEWYIRQHILSFMTDGHFAQWLLQILNFQIALCSS